MALNVIFEEQMNISSWNQGYRKCLWEDGVLGGCPMFEPQLGAG